MNSNPLSRLGNAGKAFFQKIKPGGKKYGGDTVLEKKTDAVAKKSIRGFFQQKLEKRSRAKTIKNIQNATAGEGKTALAQMDFSGLGKTTVSNLAKSMMGVFEDDKYAKQVGPYRCGNDGGAAKEIKESVNKIATKNGVVKEVDLGIEDSAILASIAKKAYGSFISLNVKNAIYEIGSKIVEYDRATKSPDGEKDSAEIQQGRNGQSEAIVKEVMSSLSSEEKKDFGFFLSHLSRMAEKNKVIDAKAMSLKSFVIATFSAFEIVKKPDGTDFNPTEGYGLGDLMNNAVMEIIEHDEEIKVAVEEAALKAIDKGGAPPTSRRSSTDSKINKIARPVLHQVDEVREGEDNTPIPADSSKEAETQKNISTNEAVKEVEGKVSISELANSVEEVAQSNLIPVIDINEEDLDGVDAAREEGIRNLDVKALALPRVGRTRKETKKEDEITRISSQANQRIAAEKANQAIRKFHKNIAAGKYKRNTGAYLIDRHQVLVLSSEGRKKHRK